MFDRYGWDRTGLVASAIGGMVAAALHGGSDRHDDVVDRLWELDGGEQLVAEYLRALGSDDGDALALIQQIAITPQPGALRYRLGRHRFAAPDAWPIRQFASAAEVLADDRDGISWYAHDPNLMGVLVAELGAGLSAFVENQAEVPGPNARVRQGVVKSWYLPDGTRVASKRANPGKPERFLREQGMYEEITRRLGGSGSASVAPRLAVLRAGRTVYAVSRWIPGPTMEAVLLSGAEPACRARWLHTFRTVMDELFDRGILWGDQSPRNMVLGPSGPILIDFEKTALTAGPVPFAARVAHCRGQVGVEELGVLCTPGELRDCLRGYFDPDGWDLDSVEPLTFPARPEVAAVLAARGVDVPTLGQYNHTDREIYDVRAPGDRYPGTIGFRVEHYLACAGHPRAGDYDRITTEVLIAARRAGRFEEVCEAVERGADALERAFVVAEFAARLAGDGPVTPPQTDVAALTALLDKLDAARAVSLR